MASASDQPVSTSGGGGADEAPDYDPPNIVEISDFNDPVAEAADDDQAGVTPLRAPPWRSS